MIRIQEHLNRADADDYLESLAENLWETLNPKLKSKSGYKQISLIEKCKKFKSQSYSNEYLAEYANNDVITRLRHQAFFDFLLNLDAQELKRIIISKPADFNSILSDIFEILLPSDLVSENNGNCSQTPFGKLLSEKIFDYKTFRGSDFCKELFTKIEFSATTCPYCNDNRVTIVKLRKNSSNETKLKAYLDLDHFYAKSRYPFFAVSFFNLIPSCHDCNSGDKKDKLFTVETHIHPYQDAFEDLYKFRISLTALLGDPINEISIDQLENKPLDITLNDLNLVARYGNNFDEAENLVALFKKHKVKIGTDLEDDFRELLLRGIPSERCKILKFQRAKMNRDILKQVDVNNFLGII